MRARGAGGEGPLYDPTSWRTRSGGLSRAERWREPRNRRRESFLLPWGSTPHPDDENLQGRSPHHRTSPSHSLCSRPSQSRSGPRAWSPRETPPAYRHAAPGTRPGTPRPPVSEPACLSGGGRGGLDGVTEAWRAVWTGGCDAAGAARADRPEREAGPEPDRPRRAGVESQTDRNNGTLRDPPVETRDGKGNRDRRAGRGARTVSSGPGRRRGRARDKRTPPRLRKEALCGQPPAPRQA